MQVFTIGLDCLFNIGDEREFEGLRMLSGMGDGTFHID